MKEKYLWIFLGVLMCIVLILVIVLIITNNQRENEKILLSTSQAQNNFAPSNSGEAIPPAPNTLPDSLTLSIYYDATSSGGSRYYNSTLTFVDGMLTAGWKKYESYPGTGGDYQIECVVDAVTFMWEDKATGNVCMLNTSSISSNLSYLREKISSGEFKPSDKCGHSNTCYSIIN